MKVTITFGNTEHKELLEAIMATKNELMQALNDLGLRVKEVGEAVVSEALQVKHAVQLLEAKVLQLQQDPSVQPDFSGEVEAIKGLITNLQLIGENVINIVPDNANEPGAITAPAVPVSTDPDAEKASPDAVTEPLDPSVVKASEEEVATPGSEADKAAESAIAVAEDSEDVEASYDYDDVEDDADLSEY